MPVLAFLAAAVAIRPIFLVLLEAFPRRKLPKSFPAEVPVRKILKRPLSVRIGNEFKTGLYLEKKLPILYSRAWLLSTDTDLAMFLHEIGHAQIFLYQSRDLISLIEAVATLFESLSLIFGAIFLKAAPEKSTALAVAAACFLSQSPRVLTEAYASYYARQRLTVFLKSPRFRLSLFLFLPLLAYYDLVLSALLASVFCQ